MGAVKPLGVVEANLLADDAFSYKAVGQLVQIIRLVFERAPLPFDIMLPMHWPWPSTEMRMPASLSAPVKAKSLRHSAPRSGIARLQ